MTVDTETLQIVGALGTRYGSESEAPYGDDPIDLSYTAAQALAHEQAGFDLALIGYHSAMPDGLQVAAFVAQKTTRLKLLIAHRPGFVQPTLAARQFATLDHFSGGRIAIHVISGAWDEEQRRDGDYLSKDERYARTDEYIDLLKKTWASGAPFDHEGTYYKVEDQFSPVKPVQKPYPPIFFGGSSEAALKVAGRHAETYAMFGETVDQIRDMVQRVRAAAAEHGRADALRFSLSLRPIIAETEEDAWHRAERILERTRARADAARSPFRGVKSEPGEGAKRLLATAEGGRVRDKRLWTEIAKLTGANGNSTALVGTPDQVVESLLDYYDAGVRTFLIRGFEPLEDTVSYGRHLLPRFRAAVAERQRKTEAAAAA